MRPEAGIAPFKNHSLETKIIVDSRPTVEARIQVMVSTPIQVGLPDGVQSLRL